MDDPHKRPAARIIAQAVTQVLERNSIAALVTLVESPAGVGAKVLIDERGVRYGSLGETALDEAVAAYAGTFLTSRTEARTFKLAEITNEPPPAPEADARLL